MYKITEDGFRAEVGGRSIVFQRSDFEDGRYYYEGEGLVSESGRLKFIVRLRKREGDLIHIILIDGDGEHEGPDLIIPPAGDGDERYCQAVYQHILEILLAALPLRPLTEFRVYGSGCISKIVGPGPDSGRLYLSKELTGLPVQVIW